MLVIPAIDMIDGRVVRLSQGDYDQRKIYSSSPLEMAKRFEGAGLTNLHLVDLDGARGGEPKNLNILSEIASKTRLKVDFGGGVKSKESLDAVLNSGADRVSLGSFASRDMETVISLAREYRGRLILSADSKAGMIAINGWLESTSTEVVSFIKAYFENGIDTVIATDISRDGMLTGPSFELYRKIMREVEGERVIASGGVASRDDLERLRSDGLYGAIVGKAYYEGRVTLEELGRVQNAC